MKRKILTLILLLVTVFGVFAINSTKNVQAVAGGETLYLKPNSNWIQGNAWFAAVFVNSSWSNSKWVEMIDTDGDGIYECTVPTDNFVTHVQFQRMNPASKNMDWNNKWDSSDTIQLSATGNLLTLANGWGGVKGTWSTYTYVAPKFHLAGTFNGWDAGSVECELKDEDGDKIYQYTIELAAGTHEFKVTNGTWDLAYGGATINDKASDVALKSDGGAANIKLVATGGVYTIAFNNNTKKLSVSVVTYAEVKAQLNEVLNPFYNNGAYTKASTIKVDKNKLEEELAVYFHAGASALERTTVYETGKLTMTANGSVAGYKTVEGNMVRFHLEGEVEVDDYTVSGTTVEEYYVTLHDFLQTSSTSNYGTLDLTSGWTVNNGVYTNTNADVLKAFELFVAPMWVGGNYVTYTKATVQVVNGELVMQLWASSTNVGLFADDYAAAADGNYLFAEVKIA